MRQTCVIILFFLSLFSSTYADETIANGLTLKIPSPGQRNWDVLYREDFAEPISSHDHTGSGKGLAIGTSAISSGAVTSAKVSFPWSTWSPTISADGFSGASTGSTYINRASYVQIGKIVHFALEFNTIITGSALFVRFTLPVTAASAIGAAFPAFYGNIDGLSNPSAIGCFGGLTTTSIGVIKQYNDPSLTGGLYFTVSGTYEAA